MAPFWWENQLVWTQKKKKKELKGELMIWRVFSLTAHFSDQHVSCGAQTHIGAAQRDTHWVHVMHILGL
jgi:hypothetical protein